MNNSLPPLKEVVAKYGLSAKKSLGQNFIFDTNLIDKIVRFAKDRNLDAFEKGTVIEIGSGPGGVTRSILNHGAHHLIAIEKDQRCLDILTDIQAVYPNKLSYLNTDALTVDASTLGNAPRTIVANLPYNVATPLLISWLHQINDFTGLTLMFQKEVAERIVAKPNTSAYGRLSILTQWLCEVEILFTVNPASFTPPPKVTSAVVAFRPRKNMLAPARFDLLEKVTAVAFNQRRKMLRSSLKTLGNVQDLCRLASICETMRAQEVSIEAFCAMAHSLEN